MDHVGALVDGRLQVELDVLKQIPRVLAARLDGAMSEQTHKAVTVGVAMRTT